MTSELNPTIIGALIGFVGIIIGWLLSFITDLVKEKLKKDKLLKSLLHELQLNQGWISYYYLYLSKLFKNLKSPSKNKKIFDNILIKLSLKKELGWGFKASVYKKAESEGVLTDLPSRGEIADIYREISILQEFGIPDDKDKSSWQAVKSKLEKLEKSLKLVTENFYKNQKEWNEIIKRELNKNSE